MKTLLLGQIKEGMITAIDVKSSDGKILLKKGTPLTNHLIQKLPQFSITELAVESTSMSDTKQQHTLAEPSADQENEKRAALIEQRFKLQPKSDIIDQLKELATKYALPLSSKKKSS